MIPINNLPNHLFNSNFLKEISIWAISLCNAIKLKHLWFFIAAIKLKLDWIWSLHFMWNHLSTCCCYCPSVKNTLSLNQRSYSDYNSDIIFKFTGLVFIATGPPLINLIKRRSLDNLGIVRHYILLGIVMRYLYRCVAKLNVVVTERCLLRRFLLLNHRSPTSSCWFNLCFIHCGCTCKDRVGWAIEILCLFIPQRWFLSNSFLLL